MYATIRDGFVYFGIQITNADTTLGCNYIQTGTTEPLPFPLGGEATFFEDYAECPKWALTVGRNLAGAIIILTLNSNKYFVTDEVAALARGAYYTAGKAS